MGTAFLFVAKYCPNKIDIKRFNWEGYSALLVFLHPGHPRIENAIWKEYTIEALNNLIIDTHAKKKAPQKIWKPHQKDSQNLLYKKPREELLRKIVITKKLSHI